MVENEYMLWGETESWWPVPWMRDMDDLSLGYTHPLDNERLPQAGRSQLCQGSRDWNRLLQG